jgi:hypothetical protein
MATDRRTELLRDKAVLQFLLDVRPQLLTVDEVTRGAALDPSCWDSRDDTKSALDRLVATGQVHQQDNLVFVAHATVLTSQAVQA